MHSKRNFLTGMALGLAGAAISPALAEAMKMKGPAPDDAPHGKTLPNRMAKTTKLYKAPGIWPNALASSPEGLWVAQQHLTESEAKGANAPYPNKGKEQAWLLDANGKLLKTCESDAVNTSGLAYGDGQLWVMSNTEDETGGAHQVDIATNKEVAHRQIPLSPNNVSGGIHGAKWKDGKLWIVNIRMHSLIRVNPKTWEPEVQFPIYAPPGMARFHDITFDKDGSLLQVIASEKSSSHTDNNVSGLVRLDPVTGKPLETITFVPGSCDPHGLELHNGQLLSVDAGYHPGWTNYDSPSSQWVFRIDMA